MGAHTLDRADERWGDILFALNHDDEMSTRGGVPIPANYFMEELQWEGTRGRARHAKPSLLLLSWLHLWLWLGDPVLPEPTFLQKRRTVLRGAWSRLWWQRLERPARRPLNRALVIARRATRGRASGAVRGTHERLARARSTIVVTILLLAAMSGRTLQRREKIKMRTKVMSGVIIVLVLAVAALGVGAAAPQSMPAPAHVQTRAEKDHRYAQLVNARYLPAPLTDDVLIALGRTICTHVGLSLWQDRHMVGFVGADGINVVELVGFTRGYYVDDGCWQDNRA